MKPDEAGLIAPRERDRAPVHREIHQREPGRNGERVRKMRPGEASFQAVVSSGDADRGAPLALDHDRRAAVEADVLRPALRAPRESDVQRSIGRRGEGERAARDGEPEVEPPRPEADGAPLQRGADSVRNLVPHPGDPRTKPRRQVPLGKRLGLRRAGEGEQAERCGEPRAFHEPSRRAASGRLPRDLGSCSPRA